MFLQLLFKKFKFLVTWLKRIHLCLLIAVQIMIWLVLGFFCLPENKTLKSANQVVLNAKFYEIFIKTYFKVSLCIPLAHWVSPF